MVNFCWVCFFVDAGEIEHREAINQIEEISPWNVCKN